MSSAKLAVACALAALALSACGTTHKQSAGEVRVTAGGHFGQTGLQIGAPQIGPSVSFEPTPGSAQEAQIKGQVEGAEVIGSALLYPNQASDKQLQVVEDCLALGVNG